MTVSQIASHSHPLLASSGSATSQSPANQVFATAQAASYFNLPDAPVNLSPLSMGSTGGSQPHTNFQPYLCVDFIISLFGIFPSPV